MNKHRKYIDIVEKFQGKKILVIGDLILDIYLTGKSTRLCPEAPVPVVDVSKKEILLGGASNTACNLSSLGADVTYCTVTGSDNAAREALVLLQNTGCDCSLIIEDSRRETIVKTRVVAGTQIAIRFDSGTQTEIDADVSEKLNNLIREHHWKFDAIVISDYDKGLLTESTIQTLKEIRQQKNIFLAIDSKRLNVFSCLRPSLVKPNYQEACKLTNGKEDYSQRVQQISLLGDLLYQRTNASIIAATLDQDGALFFNTGKMVCHRQAPHVVNPSVAGAGDTFLSAFTLTYLVSNDIETSADIAGVAAQIAISKEATSSCSISELTCHYHQTGKHVTSVDDLERICKNYKELGHRIVFTNGCYDILHSGHVTYLHCARELGDVLIVGINNDESIKRIKGEGRPINSLEDRIEVLSGLSSVTHVIAFGDPHNDTPEPLIHIIKPHVFVKGGDYTKDKLPEAAAVEMYGGEIVFIPYVPDHSTTSIIHRITNFLPSIAN